MGRIIEGYNIVLLKLVSERMNEHTRYASTGDWQKVVGKQHERVMVKKQTKQRQKKRSSSPLESNFQPVRLRAQELAAALLPLCANCAIKHKQKALASSRVSLLSC